MNTTHKQDLTEKALADFEERAWSKDAGEIVVGVHMARRLIAAARKGIEWQRIEDETSQAGIYATPQKPEPSGAMSRAELDQLSKHADGAMERLKEAFEPSPTPGDKDAERLEDLTIVAEIVAERDRLSLEVGRLKSAAQWAIPLAEIALENHRTGRIKAGHSDIRGKHADGRLVIGLWQDEIDEWDKARTALAGASNSPSSRS